MEAFTSMLAGFWPIFLIKREQRFSSKPIFPVKILLNRKACEQSYMQLAGPHSKCSLLR